MMNIIAPAAPSARGVTTLGGVAVLVLAGATVSAVSARQRTSAPAPLVFDGVTIVDVEQGKLVPDQRVVIAGNHIKTVGNSSSVSVPRGAQIVPAQGKYLIPGLWDMHVHPGIVGFTLAPSSGAAPPTDVAYLLFIVNGVTGFRDASSEVPLDTLVRWQREILAGARVGPPRQLLSGVALNASESCDRDSTAWTRSICITAGDSADVDHLVKTLNKAGATWLKTYSLDEKTYFLLAAAARRAGMQFGGHAPNVNPFDADDLVAQIRARVQ